MMTDHRLADLGSTTGYPILCKSVGFAGLAAGIAVTVANLDDGAITSILGQVRGDVVGAIAGVAAAVSAFCWALVRFTRFRRFMSAVALVYLIACLVGLVSITAVGWARLLGFAPFGMAPAVAAGSAFGALIVAGSLVALAACLTPFTHRPMHGLGRAEDKIAAALIVGVLSLVVPGSASAMVGMEKLGIISTPERR